MNGATKAFITAHADDDVRQLALRGTKDPEVSLSFALEQIAGRQTARRKLPTWAATDGIVYPPHLSMEQCSSELTARYKAGLAGGGNLLVDLTGGFGVDFSFMARGFSRAVYVERQQRLCDIARQNLDVLGLAGAEVVCADGTDYLQTMDRADVVFMDPARRDAHGGRTYGISDCEPDVLSLRERLLAKAQRAIIKLSPMLDWRKAVSDLGSELVSGVHIVSVDNECKELLVTMEAGGGTAGKTLPIYCVNLTGNGSPQCFTSHYEPGNGSPQCFAGQYGPGLEDAGGKNKAPAAGYYLYEPHSSVMKAGCFAELSRRFGIGQVGANSHLFVSATRVEGFPGREFVIEGVTSMNRRELKHHLGALSQANITVRNFPLTVAQLRSRLKISEGGSTYLFATTLADKSHVLLVTRKPCTEPSSR